MINVNDNFTSETKIGSQEYKDCKDCKEDNLANHKTSDLFYKYIHDIRNMIYLDDEMIKNIHDMSNENKMDIIIVFNTIVNALTEIIVEFIPE